MMYSSVHTVCVCVRELLYDDLFTHEREKERERERERERENSCMMYSSVHTVCVCA